MKKIVLSSLCLLTFSAHGAMTQEQKISIAKQERWSHMFEQLKAYL